MKESLTVLIVDDESAILDLLSRFLSIKGFDVKTATGGQEALDCLKIGNIDLVIADITMPQMDGFELLRSIKKIYPDIHVIMMTGKGDADTVREATLLGADEYIIKPFKNDELSMVIERTAWKIMSRISGARK